MENYSQTITYSILIGDLLHFGHLKMLEAAKNSANHHICGVISDDSARKWISPLICNFEERKSVISSIKFVDEVMLQDSLDPTENLKIIHQRFPQAKLLLMQNHIIGGANILGIDYIREIGGDLIPHNFYSRLSQDFIKRSYYTDLLSKQSIKDLPLNKIQIGNIDAYRDNFSTKANTIQKLRQVLKSSVVEKEFVFSVDQWNNGKEKIVVEIRKLFAGNTIVVRSSSINEDSVDFSNAGHFASVLDVNSSDGKHIAAAVNTVVESYLRVGDTNPENQILVQNQTLEVAVSGVIFTRNLWTNTPYYLINFDDKSARTDTVTGGDASNKVEILNDIAIEQIDPKWRKLIVAVREIEQMFPGMTLDVEFALRLDGDVVIFQVRPLAANSRFFSLDDERIKESIGTLMKTYVELRNSREILSKEVFLSDMAFWNPAELIGDRPAYLDYSIFNHLLMKTNWNEALIPLGYTPINSALLHSFAGKPYINVHHAFLSLLPVNLSSPLKIKLLQFYNEKLRKNPELHDKIEFEIVHNCMHFRFDEAALELLHQGFKQSEIDELRAALTKLTDGMLLGYKDILKTDDASIAELENRYLQLFKEIEEKQRESQALPWNEKLHLVRQLIEDCKILGTTQFSRIARMAFVGNALLRSLRDIGAISRPDYDNFTNSIQTVATEMDRDFTKLRRRQLTSEIFLQKYGHLRPGTYDITKLPYSKNPIYLNPDLAVTSEMNNPAPGSHGEISAILQDRISQQCKAINLSVDGEAILDFISKSIELREYYKFIYTKNISLALELIADVGEEFGFSRDQLSLLDYQTIISTGATCSREEAIDTWTNLIRGRRESRNLNIQISLPPVIFSENDFHIVPSYLSKPNFITDSVIDGEVLLLDKNPGAPILTGKIIVLEKADPGYDWIFTKQIKGLITKYGGAASHMAIRCAEFNIPAAIGCGDLLFSRISDSSRISLDCRNKSLYILHK